MTYLTEARIKAKICDIDFGTLHKIAGFLEDKKVDFYWCFDRLTNDKIPMYTLEADVTGFSAELYVYLDNISK